MQKTAKVIILMSTYNGETYLEEQLQSIFNQTYKNYQLIVRDDGSKDQTLAILKRHEKNGSLTLICGENIGFIKSFFSLVVNAPDADYYSFADQDDFWLNNKIERAVALMDQKDKSQPVLYFSNYDFYDTNMIFIEKGNRIKEPFSLLNTVINAETSMGFAMVFNASLRAEVINNQPDLNAILGHDYWFYLVGITLGSLIYDKEITTHYRRHSKNVSSFNTNFFKQQIWRIKHFLFNNEAQKISKTVALFADLYEYKLSSSDKTIINTFKHSNYSLTKALRKTFYPVRMRDTLLDEIAIRIIFLIGKM